MKQVQTQTTAEVSNQDKLSILDGQSDSYQGLKEILNDEDEASHGI